MAPRSHIASLLKTAAQDTLVRGLIILLLALVIPGIVFSSVITYKWVRLEQEQLEAETRRINASVAGRLELYIQGQITMLQALATSPALDAKDLEPFDAQARALLARTGIHLVMRDLTGQQIVNTRLSRGAALPQSSLEADRIVIGRKQPYVSDLVIGAVTRSPLIVVAVPVIRNGEVAYVLNASLPPIAIAEVLDAAGIAWPYSASVVDRTGRIIARSENSSLFTGKPHPEFLQARGQNGTWRGVNPQGVPVVGAYSRLPISGWLVTVGVEQAALRAPLNRSILLLAGLAVALSVASLTGAWLIGKRIYKQQRQLSEAEALYRLLAENTTDMIVRADTSARRLYVSPACLDLTGFTPAELIGTSPRDFVHTDDAEGLDKKLIVLERGEADRIKSIHRLRHKRGDWIWVEVNFHLVRTSLGEPYEVVSTVRDVSDRVQLEEHLRRLATSDGLTGLANRRAFDERLDQEWRRAERASQPLTLAIFDVDFFKKYNDHLGHAAGDACLREVAAAIDRGRRASDLAARLGGEEFCLILPGTDTAGAQAVADTVRFAIEKLAIPHPESPHRFVTVSAGIASTDLVTAHSGAALLEAADRALYDAKRAGRNTVIQARDIAEHARQEAGRPTLSIVASR